VPAALHDGLFAGFAPGHDGGRVQRRALVGGAVRVAVDPDAARVDVRAVADAFEHGRRRGPVDGGAVVAAGGRLVIPGLVYGDHAGLIEAFFASKLQYIGDGANHWPLVHRDDIADLYVRALNAPAGTRYIGVGPGEPTLREAVEALAGGAAESISLEDARDTMGPIADAFALDQRFSSERARTQLGWAPRHTDPLSELAQRAEVAT